MAYFYVDTDGSGATAPYDTWAKAAQDLPTALGAMSAGDIVFMQGAAKDTAAGARSLTSTGTLTNPCLVIGVKDGTTNEGAAITTTDIAVRGTDTLPEFELTGAGSDLTVSGLAHVCGIKITSPDRIFMNGISHRWSFIGCEIVFGGLVFVQNGAMGFSNCEMEFTSTSSAFLGRSTTLYSPSEKSITVYGGVSTFTASPTQYIFDSVDSSIEIVGHDLSGLTTTLMKVDADNRARVLLKNCKVPASYTKLSTNFSGFNGCLEMIGCNSNAAAKGNTTSYQDYYFEDAFGTVENESTVIRTNGADDGASGGFSYAMTPHANTTKESSNATLESPWMAVWVAGGASKTLTVYIANSSASTDYNEDEAWCEFFTPDDGDTAQHDQTFNPATGRLVNSTTIITDDTGSTWGTGGNNHQKFSMTTTPGFEGWVYARVHLAKRQATPDTLYLDPKIAVS